MNTRGSPHYPLFVLFSSILLLLSACQPAALTTSPQPTQPSTQPSATPEDLATQTPVQSTQSSATPEVLATQTLAQPTQTSSGELAGITLDYSAVAQNMTVETMPGQPGGSGYTIWEAETQYRLLTLQGYPIANNKLKPQIFLYPAEELASVDENTKKAITDLKALLQTQQAGEKLPFLPLFNSVQVIHVQVQYLDFKSGKGVRFLTQYNQAPLPINNDELFYTFQGLTSDGKYYVTAILPVTLPELPSGADVIEQQSSVLNDFQGYLSKLTKNLDQQPASNFSPDLSKLDALVSSIEIK